MLNESGKEPLSLRDSNAPALQGKSIHLSDILSLNKNTSPMNGTLGPEPKGFFSNKREVNDYHSNFLETKDAKN
jgi:hypothetical protein